MARVSLATRVAFGKKMSPAASPVATHTLVQNGQVTSSPTALRPPWPRTSSCSSAGPVVPWYEVNGARSGLVTGSLASSLLSLWVASAHSVMSAGEKPSGTSRPVTRTAPATAPSTPL